MTKRNFILFPIPFLLLCMLFVQPVQAQKHHDKNNDYNEMAPGDEVEPGVDFIIGAGIYFGSKKTAGYYSGIPDNENNVNYIFENYSWHKQILEEIAANYNHFSINDTTLRIGGYPLNIAYKPAMSITLGASYRFDKHWRISIYYSFARLVASNFFTLTFDGTLGNLDDNILPCPIVGKENRSFFDLTGSYTFQVHKIVKPYIEFGAQFNFVRVKSFETKIGEREFNLLDIYGGNTYVQGVDMQEIDKKYGGPGFAVMASTGIKFAFSKAVSIDPCFYISFGKIGLEGYKDFHFNYGAYVRLVMSDAMFSK